MPRAFLAVFTHPSSSLPLQEFHAWYEEEHIPIRMDRLREFLSGARYQALPPTPDMSDTKPNPDLDWLAMYEIIDTSTFSNPKYTRLRDERSEREKGVMGRLERLVRILGEEVVAKGHGGTTGMKVGNPTQWIVTHTVSDVGRMEDEFNLGDGWLGTRVVKVLEKAEVGLGAVPVPSAPAKVNYFVVHDFATEIAASSLTPGQIEKIFNENVKIGDWRRWRLHKAYPGIAQAEVKAG